MAPFSISCPMGYLVLSLAGVMMPPIICVAWTKRDPSFFLSVKQKVGLFLNSPFKHVSKFCQAIKSTIWSFSIGHLNIINLSCYSISWEASSLQYTGIFKKWIFHMLTNNTNLWRWIFRLLLTSTSHRRPKEHFWINKKLPITFSPYFILTRVNNGRNAHLDLGTRVIYFLLKVHHC